MAHQTLVNLLRVSFSYDGAAPILSGLDFTLKEGEVKYISGHSGCGKSTFLKILNRLVEPVAGNLQFGQKPYGAWDVKELRKNIQLVQQIPILFNATVGDNLRLATPNASPEEIKYLLDAFNLPPGILGKNAKNISVGQAQRICVARALLLRPKVLLMDEPTAALDMENREIFQNAFDHVRAERGLAAVWVTHDVERAGRMDGGHLAMKGGRLHDN